jgi:hypothetical protein
MNAELLLQQMLDTKHLLLKSKDGKVVITDDVSTHGILIGEVKCQTVSNTDLSITHQQVTRVNVINKFVQHVSRRRKQLHHLFHQAVSSLLL